MGTNSKAWLAGSVLGVLGIIMSAGVFIFITLKTERIFGIVAVLCGALSGGAVGLGYKVAKGELTSKSQVTSFLWVLTFFGLLGVLTAYFGPYILFLGDLSFGEYISFIELDIKDAFFIFIGAYGGRWVGEAIARSIILKGMKQEALQDIKQTRIQNIDKKLK